MDEILPTSRVGKISQIKPRTLPATTFEITQMNYKSTYYHGYKQCDNDLCMRLSLFSWIFTWVMADSSDDGVGYMLNTESNMTHCAYWYWLES